MNMLISASAFAAAVPAIAQDSSAEDPIFAAIEAHKQAIRDERAPGDAYSIISASAPKGYTFRTSKAAKKWCRVSGFDDAEADYHDAFNHVGECAQVMLETPPTTFAGLAALLEHIEGFAARDDEWEMAGEYWWKVAFKVLAKSARQISTNSCAAPVST